MLVDRPSFGASGTIIVDKRKVPPSHHEHDDQARTAALQSRTRVNQSQGKNQLLEIERLDFAHEL